MPAHTGPIIRTTGYTMGKQWDIDEAKRHVFGRDCYTCQVCGAHIAAHGTPQLAHLIPQTKINLLKYGKKIIHSHANLKSVCCLRCNGMLSLHGKPLQIQRQLEVIKNYESNLIDPCYVPPIR